MKKDNITTVLAKFAKKLNVPLESHKVYDELLIHPDYPSLLAISDVLTNFNIDSAAYRVDADELALIPRPFMAHTRLKGGEFILITAIENDFIIFSDDKRDKQKMRLKHFEKIYSGVVLTAETDLNSVQDGPPFNIAALKTPFIIACSLLMLMVAVIFHSSYLTNFSWPLLLLTLAKSAGLATSVLLLIQSIDNSNPLVQKLCQAGGKSNCSDILSSKAAKVFGWLTWSEVGFFYFAGTWLLLIFGGATAPAWQILALLNIISLPYTFYSIYYQARIAKQWCVLCCTVQALLWVEFIAIVAHFINNINISPLSFGEGWGEAFIALALPVVLWMLLKPLLLQAQKITPLKQQLHKFKYNAELFDKMLVAQPKYTQPDEEWSIVLGNAEAEHTITMVSNPYCPPCAKMHKSLHELLELRPDIQARIVLTADNTETDKKTPVSRHLMTLHGLPDKSIVKQALYDWYEQKQKNYESWAKAYPVELNEAEYNKINRQKAWCDLAEISATPTMLLDGYRLPEGYLLTDLKYMLQ